MTTIIPGLPDKERYCISEIVPFFAAVLGVSDNAARIRIHRAIYAQRLQAKSYLGSLRIPRDEVHRMLTGEDPAR